MHILDRLRRDYPKLFSEEEASKSVTAEVFQALAMDELALEHHDCGEEPQCLIRLLELADKASKAAAEALALADKDKTPKNIEKAAILKRFAEIAVLNYLKAAREREEGIPCAEPVWKGENNRPYWQRDVVPIKLQ